MLFFVLICVKVVSYFAISFATFAVTMCLIHTVMALLRRKIFVPDDKWAPTSFMKLTHEAVKNGKIL